MAEELGAISHYGTTLFSAKSLESAFAWALAHKTSIAWIEAIMISDHGTEPSMEHSRAVENFKGYDAFRESCLIAASAWNKIAEMEHATAYFEIGLWKSS